MLNFNTLKHLFGPQIDTIGNINWLLHTIIDTKIDYWLHFVTTKQQPILY